VVILLVAFGVYLVVLAALGWVLEDHVAGKVEQRMAEALDAEVEVGAVSLGLIGGHIEVRDVRIERRHLGHLDLTIDQVNIDTAPLGWVAVDRAPDFVELSGVTMSMSGAGALKLPKRPKRAPLHIGGMRLRDVEVSATAIQSIPGLASFTLTVAEARTGPVTLSSAIDWVFALEHLDASTKLPAGITASVQYTPGELALAGSIFGSRPIRLPFTIPTPPPEALEMEKVRLLARAVLDTVGKELARSWLKSKVSDVFGDMLD